jgi:hypothetical protein
MTARQRLFFLSAVFGRHPEVIDVFRGSYFRDNPPLFRGISATPGMTLRTAKGGNVLAKLQHGGSASQPVGNL